MGTRAIITMNGDPIIATHWDGYPEGLGEDLKGIMPDTTIEAIIAVAEKHSIDFIRNDIGEKVKAQRLNELVKKHNLSLAEIKEGKRRGAVTGNDDYEIGDIAIYDDWAEYQYDVRPDGIYCRELHGTWQQHRASDDWTRLGGEAK